MKSILNDDPYRLHFLAGIICGSMGASLWILALIEGFSPYPSAIHGQIMILGFILSFICGFLMTAIPRMTGTMRATQLEKVLSISAILLTNFLAFFGNSDLAWFVAIFPFVFLFIFVGRRLILLKTLPHPGLIFVPVGIALGLVGTLLHSFSHYLSSEVVNLSKILVFEGLTLNLILGVGGRIIPMLSRKTGAVLSQGFWNNQIVQKIQYLELILINGSFLLQIYVDSSLGYFLRSLVLAFACFYNFYLHRPATNQTKLGICTQFAVYCLPIGYLLTGLFSAYSIHFLHLVFIGGFTLLTLMVSSHVSIAHGGLAIETESNRPLFWGLLFSFLAIIVTRVLVPIITPENLFLGLSIVAVCFITLLMTWLFAFRKALLYK